jgi:PhnB protein
MSNKVQAVPEGFGTVTPYLGVTGIARLIPFLEQAFGATETARHTRPDGAIQHAEVSIGTSRVMMGEAREQWNPMPARLYLYVPDVDNVYKRALAAGGTSLTEPANQPYGDRSAGIQDPSGNQWFIATRIEDVSPEELAKRMEEAGRSE